VNADELPRARTCTPCQEDRDHECCADVGGVMFTVPFSGNGTFTCACHEAGHPPRLLPLFEVDVQSTEQMIETAVEQAAERSRLRGGIRFAGVGPDQFGTSQLDLGIMRWDVPLRDRLKMRVICRRRWHRRCDVCDPLGWLR